MLAAVVTAPVPSSPALWRSALQGCSLLVAADAGLQSLAALGLTVDAAVGDFDSWQSAWGRPQDAARQVVSLDTDKDDSDTDAAVRWALDHGATEIWLFGGAGSRTDHWFSNLRLVAQTPALCRWYTEAEVLHRLASPDSATYGPGALSVLPVGRGPWKLSSRGLAWELDDVDFSTRISLSNRVATSAQVHCHLGQVLVVRPLEQDGRP